MGSGAVSKLPERIDKEHLKELVPPEAYDEAFVEKYAAPDGTIDREDLRRRATAMSEISEAAKMKAESGINEAVLAKLRAAHDAEPGFLNGCRIYADALNTIGRMEEAVSLLLQFKSPDEKEQDGARQTAQVILVNAGVERLNARDVPGALAILSRAEDLGDLPKGAKVVVASAKYMELRSAIMNKLSLDVVGGLEQLHTELEAMDTDSEEGRALLEQVVATESLAVGMQNMKSGHAAAAAANFEKAADAGEPGARCLAAEAYLKAAMDEFTSFTNARVTTGPAGPPSLTRALSDHGHGELTECAGTLALLFDVTAVAREEIANMGSEKATPVLERLSEIDDLASKLLDRITSIQGMDAELRLKRSGHLHASLDFGDDDGAKDERGDAEAALAKSEGITEEVAASPAAGSEPRAMMKESFLGRIRARSRLAAAEAMMKESFLVLDEAKSKQEHLDAATEEIKAKLGALLEAVPGASIRATAADEREDGADPWHGHLGAGRDWELPQTVAASAAEARPGYWAYDATEYLDTPEVLKAKISELASLWKQSRNCVIYTGAGLSTSAGLGDYATKARGSVVADEGSGSKTAGSRLELAPTRAHHGLASLGDGGFIKHWVQQNHDRLAQKAGFPQAKLNEIHGAWGDNKNTVKMMDDILRKDLLDWLQAWTERADMCVAIGTSLCGMNADRVVDAVCSRYPDNGQGLVVIGLQRSVYDHKATLRIWGLCDDVIALVCKELGVPCPDKKLRRRGDDWKNSHPRLKYNTPKRTARDPM